MAAPHSLLHDQDLSGRWSPEASAFSFLGRMRGHKRALDAGTAREKLPIDA